MKAFQLTTYLSPIELKQLAAARFEEAATVPPGPRKEQILRAAHGFENLAEIKGWLSSELQPPK